MKRGIVICLLIIFLSIQVLAVAIEDNIPIQIQTTDASGNIVTGTFTFTINISNSNTCSPVLYSNVTTQATDTRGIVSYNLENVALAFDEQYYFCYYRDSVLKETSKIGRTPYAFRAKNVSLSGVDVNSNLNMTGFNITNIGIGFFTYLGSVANKITHIFVDNIDVVGDVNASGTIKATSFVGGGSGVTNVIASDLGDIGCSADKYLQWDGGNWICANMPSAGSNVYVNLIPEGTVAAFNRSVCPEGWSPANGSNGTPDLRGIFVRGSGTSGVLTMANGTAFSATYGEYQNDSFQGHYHFNMGVLGAGAVSSIYSRYNSDGTDYDPTFQHVREPITDGTHGTPRTGGETRPANIALLYCVKDVETSPETGNLFDISGNLIYVKNTSHDVGIGTLVPNAKLEVNGTFSVKNATAGQGLYQDAAGNVGIGTSTPQNKLNVDGDVNITGNLSLGNGQIMFNDTSKSYMYYNSTAWVEFGTGSGGGVPANTISAFYQSTCPNGWILADGTSGTPDLRGIFIRGAGTNGVLSMANGTAFSATYGSYQNDSFQGHFHDIHANVGSSGTTADPTKTYANSNTAWANIDLSHFWIREAETAGAAYGTPRTGAETRPASFGLIYCMKTTEDTETSNTIWGESGDDIVPNNSSKNVHLYQNLTVGGNVNITGNTSGLSKIFTTDTITKTKAGVSGWQYSSYVACPSDYPDLISCTMSYIYWKNRGGYSETYAAGCDIDGDTCRAKVYNSVTYDVQTTCTLTCIRL